MDDAEQVTRLYAQHVGPARALAVAITGEPALAEDIVHDAFIRCVSRLDRLRNPERFRAYLFRAVVRTAASQFRRRRVERRSLQRLVAAPEPDRVEAGGDLAADLLLALRALPVRQRTAVAARFLFDWSEQQTAVAMGCRIGTVKSLTSRGLTTLRVRLEDREVADHD